jgi:serine O-acetyltransferase
MSPMEPSDLNLRLPGLVDSLVDSIIHEPRMKHLDRAFLPSRDEIVACIALLRQLMFPGYFGKQGLTSTTVRYRVGELVNELTERLLEQIRHCLPFRGGNGTEPADRNACVSAAAEILSGFLDRLPAVRAILSTDVQAAFDSDPAAQSTDETVFSYPGLYAITVQRLAHELFLLDVPLLPRIMTEYAHGQTGIDIHPGAELGERFFIDHGTGVVIGETTEIGNNVKIYQGVTLGAVAPDFGQALRGRKRHPTIEDDVTIYAGATILGGETIIGRGSVIGGNVFITQTVPPQNRVSLEPPKLKYREKRRRDKPSDEMIDFQI